MTSRGRRPYRAFGSWLRSGRLARRWTQEELARLLDYDVTYVRKIEWGERRPSDAFLTRLAQVLGVPASALPPSSPDLLSSRLPIPATPLVGREQETGTVLELLRSGTRLVTLLGAPGIGKTRVAIEVASRLDEQLQGGACFVPLATVSVPDDIIDAIATALPDASPRGSASEERLVDRLRMQEVLLVLDNFEHVISAAALVGHLLREVPTLRVLVTSRAALGLAMETHYWVPPLALPERASGSEPAALEQTAAVELFVSRARMVHPEFRLDAAVAPVVAEICTRLQGLPLAIELAAATARLLPPSELLVRLGDGLDLPVSGPRDAPAHQRTLRAAIDWSHRLLDRDERSAFARLGVFAGGFTVEAVEAVLGLPDEHGRDGVSCVASLVGKSLLEPIQGAAGGARFIPLASVRAFALERLHERREMDQFQRRHAEFFTELAEHAYQRLVGAELEHWLRVLEDEHANYRAALKWSLGSDPEVATRLAGALWRFWWIRGHLSEGRQFLDAALANGRWRSREQVRALNGAGVLIRTQGAYGVAGERFDEAAAVARAIADDDGLALALLNLGMIAENRSQLTRASSLFHEARAIYTALGDERGMGHALNCLGKVLLDEGDLKEATRSFRESLRLFRSTGDPWSVAHALTNLGWVADQEGQHALARSFDEESLAVYQGLGDERGVANSLSNLGLVSLHEGDVDQGSGLLEEALLTFARLGDRPGIAECLQELAAVAIAVHDREQAARLLGAVEAVRQTTGASAIEPGGQQHDRLAELRAELGEAAFLVAWEEGRTRSVAEAIQMAVARRHRAADPVPPRAPTALPSQRG